MTSSAIKLKNPALAALLAWLVPGLGHIYQGRYAKGVLYFTCILGLFGLGFYLGDGQVVYWKWVNPLVDPDNFRLYYIGQFFAGLVALPALIQATLDAWGHGLILWGFEAMPDVATLNSLHPKLGKLVEVGSVYTTIAGLVNIFAIYDAYDGPAFSDGTEPEAAPKAEASAKPREGLSVEGRA
ncbi:MAG TPA: DUF6677 family protein [Isosphaeraceae bacterium]|jgi:hypothetical protein|nr:DUF6677 family protein [Isosphaeraceae bacterium]